QKVINETPKNDYSLGIHTMRSFPKQSNQSTDAVVIFGRIYIQKSEKKKLMNFEIPGTVKT
ncbi:hypothetical protein L9F63_001962, partial [Diploptera punctata]